MISYSHAHGQEQTPLQQVRESGHTWVLEPSMQESPYFRLKTKDYYRILETKKQKKITRVRKAQAQDMVTQ